MERKKDWTNILFLSLTPVIGIFGAYAGALSINDRENYAVLMRVAMLSALNGADTTMNLGFRCVREVR